MGPPLLTPFDLARITLRVSAVIIDIWAQGQRLEGRACLPPRAASYVIVSRILVNNTD
jgi:hypothetical protein